MTARWRPDFGDLVSGTVADEHDWTARGPRIIRPKRTVRGTVIGLYGDAPDVARIETKDGERVCVRVAYLIPPRKG